MVKEVLLGATGVIVVAAVIAAIRYRMSKNEAGEEVEQIFVDKLNIGEIKSWFVGKMENENQKGVVFLPTRENTEKWKVKMPENQHQIIQIVYDMNLDQVVAYRQIAFTEMSDKLKTLLDSNGGTLVIDK